MEGKAPRAVPLRLLLLGLGFAIGVGTHPERWFTSRSAEGGADSNEPPELASIGGAPDAPPADNGLATLRLEIPPTSLASLQRARRSAIERGILAPAAKVVLPARVAFDDQDLEAKLRLKGDWTDHLEGERWSYRIRLGDGSFQGMREFSIQAPKTRNFLWEWLVLHAGQRAGLLAPRSTFVNVVQNGKNLGVYFLEEHFTKELLEFQGRREGPIVAWDETTLWNTLLREGSIPALGQLGFASAVSDVAESLDPAEVRAYDEQRSRTTPARAAALDALDALRALVLDDLPDTPRLRVLQAREGLRGRTLADLVDVDRLARAHALLSVFQAEHPLVWHNLRFYYDPALARLEPILFDNMVGSGAARGPIPWRPGITAEYARDRDYYDGVFLHLRALLAPEWIEELFEELSPELARFEQALRTEGTLPPGFGVADMRRRLRAGIAALRPLCLPEEPVGLDLGIAGDALELSAWSTTRAAVLLEELRFDDGSVVSAQSCLSVPPGQARVIGDGVSLPPDGSPVMFRFRAPAAKTARVRLALRPLAAGEASERVLVPRSREHGFDAGAAFEPSTLVELLERHAFLRYDACSEVLRVLPGTWDVHSDLVIPAEVPLVVPPGTTLRFGAEVRLLSLAPLFFRGSELQPVELRPLDGAPTWGGIVVRSAGRRSAWEHVRVSSASVAFERSPASLRTCRFERAVDTAALAASAADFLLEGLAFEGNRSAFTGEAITGEVEDCVFRDGEHGLALRRSSVNLRANSFEEFTGEAMAFDEGTNARVEAGAIAEVDLGVVARGASEVEVVDLRVDSVRSHALAALLGATEESATITARGIQSEGGADCVAETGCTLVIDGRNQVTRPVEAALSRGPHVVPGER